MRAKIQECLQRLRRDERGLTTVEYAIVLCLIAAVAVGLWQQLGTMVYDELESSNGKIQTAFDDAP
jgi:Flp pilus assembly pilin Flp